MENTLLPQFDRNRHGSLYDRGGADAYYGRPRKAHWWPEGTYKGEEVLAASAEEEAEYTAGFNDCTDRKEWC